MSEQPKRDYHERDVEMLALVLGHKIQPLFAGSMHIQRLICAECWKTTSHLDFQVTKDITLADALEPGVYWSPCAFCHRELRDLVPPAEKASGNL